MNWGESYCPLYLKNFPHIVSTSILMSKLRMGRKHTGHILSLGLLSLGSPDSGLQNDRYTRKSYWRLIQSSEMSPVFTMQETLTSSGINLTSTLTQKLTLTLFLSVALTLMLPPTQSLNQMVRGTLCSRSHLTWTLTQQVGEHLGSEGKMVTW